MRNSMRTLWVLFQAGFVLATSPPVIQEEIDPEILRDFVEGENHTNLEGLSGIFRSPNFPEEYPASANFTWKITVPDDKFVELSFHLFNVERGDRCQWDWVKIYDFNGKTLLKQICGYLQQDLVQTFNKSSIFIKLHSDTVIHKSGFLASWKAVPSTENNEVDVDNSKDKKKAGYILTFPQSLTSSKETSPETTCLQIFNVNVKGKVFINVFSSENILSGNPTTYKEIEYDPSVHGQGLNCYEIELPHDFPKKKYAIININGTFDGLDYNILSYKTLRVIKVSFKTLTQTDKGEYRPEQKVKFRVLKLDGELRPSKNRTIDEIYVKSPSGATMAQFKNVTLSSQGVGQFEYELDKEPELGPWRILVRVLQSDSIEPVEDIAVFVVNEAVLPKFEVQIESSKAVLAESENVDFQVCGVYTHGSKVKGSVKAVFTHKYRVGTYWRAPYKVFNLTKEAQIVEDDSCAKISINSTELASLSKKTEQPFTLTAFITESGTDIVQNSTIENKVIFTHAKVDFGDSSTAHIVGGFPYVFSFRLTDQLTGNPIKEANVKLCSRLFHDIQKFRNTIQDKYRNLYASDEDQFYDLGTFLVGILLKETCINVTTSAKDGFVKFGIPLSGLTPNVTKLSLKVTALDYKANETTRMRITEAKHDVVLTHIANGTKDDELHRLTIRERLVDDESKVKLNCKGDTNITVYFQAKLGAVVDLNYVVSSGGSLIHSGVERVEVTTNDTAKYLDGLNTYPSLGYVNVSSADDYSPVLKSFIISLKRPFLMERKITKYVKVLVFTRDVDSGRTLNSAKEYETEPCIVKPVLTWTPSETHPSQKVSLKIASKPLSLCGYSVLDKSADLVDNPNTITSEKFQEIKENLAKRKIISDETIGDRCKNAEYLFQAIQRIGLFILSDTLVHDLKCDTVVDSTIYNSFNKEYEYYDEPAAIVGSPPQSVGYEAAPSPVNRFEGPSANSARPIQQNKQGAISLSSPTISLRDYFPETWLFDTVFLSEDESEIQINVSTPHTITTWIADGFCSHIDGGFSVADRASLKVSQDFFADVNSPYSAKRGEIVQINVTSFNKVDIPLPIKLSMLESEGDYSTINGSETTICVKPRGSLVAEFFVKYERLQEVNMTVKAVIVEDLSCGDVPKESVGYADTIVKPIHIKPEGFPQEKVNTYFLCGDQNLTNLDNVIPPENILVQDSVRSKFSVSGDIMAPAVKNLDRLVALPTGCGEQTMIRMVPNIYLMDYLKSVGKDFPELTSKALNNMRVGYDRQNKKFRHKDGSYSIWGPSNESSEGSMWLTAYVVKAFAQASKYIDVNVNMLKESVKWIMKRQDRETGCFRNEGYAYSVNSPKETLTSHVLITLFEAQYIAGVKEIGDSKVIHKALQCLSNSEKEQQVEKEDEVESIYARSLKTYAVNLIETQEELKKEIEDNYKSIKASTLYKKLLEVSERDDKGLLHWKNNSSKSRSVEMTSYNIMTLLFNDKLIDALSAIRWVSQYRNARGGYISTQDTVVALQAISAYSTRVFENSTDLTVNLYRNDEKLESFKITEDDKLLLRRRDIEKVKDLKVSSSGKGCYSFQTVVKYNTMSNEGNDQPQFRLTAEANETSLTVCANYQGKEKESNMVILEVELLSGFEVAKYSLEVLLNEIDSGVEKYEIDEKQGKFFIYFEKMKKDEELSCWDFEVKKVREVMDIKPALVKVYDYYSQEDVFTTSYKI